MARTIVKKIVIGTPVKNVTELRFIDGLADVNAKQKQHLDILVWDSDQSEYVSSFISAPGFNITYSTDSDKILLSLAQINGGTY